MLIQVLYEGQTGEVNSSPYFNIEREVRQGHVLSTILFNCTLDIVFERWKFMLNIRIRLVNTCYADDCSLHATSLKELQQMAE